MEGPFALKGSHRTRFDDLVRSLGASAEACRRLAVSGAPAPLARALRELARVRRGQLEELLPWAGVHASRASAGVHAAILGSWPAMARAMKDGLLGPLLDALEPAERSIEALHRELAQATAGTPLSPILTRHLDQARPAVEGLRAIRAALPEAA